MNKQGWWINFGMVFFIIFVPIVSFFIIDRVFLGDALVDLSNTQVPKIKDKLTKAILSEMKKKEMSQGEVAKLTGMDRRNVNKTLRGTERGISINQLIRIANAIGLKVELIVKNK